MDWKRENYFRSMLFGAWGLLNHGLSWSKIIKFWFRFVQYQLYFLICSIRLSFIIVSLKDLIPMNRNPLKGVHFVASAAYQTKHSQVSSGEGKWSLPRWLLLSFKMYKQKSIVKEEYLLKGHFKTCVLAIFFHTSG